MSKQAKDTGTVTTIDDAPEAAPQVKAKEVDVVDHGDNFTGEKVEIIIHAGEGEMGKQAVFLAINGHGLNIPRDIPVVVPREVAEQLENCKQTIYDMTEGGGNREREVRRFAMTIKEIRSRK